MLWQKLRALAPPRGGGGEYKVVPHRPVWRVIILTLLAGVVAGAVAFGYWLGAGTAALDRSLLVSLQMRDRANEKRIGELHRLLADARLAQSVDAQAARSLRETISSLRNEMAGLQEEVTFYKSLMAPSSVERGLQIAEFELAPGGEDREFVYHILLTQVAERRDWVQGKVEVEVHGVREGTQGPGAQEVLPLTDLAAVATYPLKFRFRYFQDLSGTVTLPAGFEPQAVSIKVTPAGRSGNGAQRSFDWVVRAG